MLVLRVALANVAVGMLALSAAYGQQQATPTVSVVPADKRAIAEAVRFVGRIEAVERVDIRARVTGYLDAVLFKDGDFVKGNSPLYRIEKGPFEASLQQAQGSVMRSEAQVVNATAQRQRAEEL